ncbi:two component transcriptional regulator, winged helix family [Desulfuromonas acetoxidans DSM 684]|uniref:Two component transcriptional regulator, winged helix family n=2 Tax=Desulfuromonas acetoxidans TaxID=891 RepID=Q1JYZ5_DESA6|nr:two component transcriptional regulator, winged helix family [Desulfuromonas acetoxidans DSM 684]
MSSDRSFIIIDAQTIGAAEAVLNPQQTKSNHMTMRKHLFLVEDDQRLGDLITSYLTQQGFSVTIERRGDSAPARILDEQPDLVVLDLLLPGLDGLTICQQVRTGYGGPILMLTALEDDMDQVAGLEMGADDYVKKPVQPRVLLARIRALLRRVEKTAAETDTASVPINELVFGGLRINHTAQSVLLNQQPVILTTNEFNLLWLLARHAGQILDRATIYRELRGIDYDGLDRSVDLTISHLRKKLEDDADRPQRIKTVWGQGYLFALQA